MKMVMQGHFSLVCTVTYDEHKIVGRTNYEWSTLYVIMLTAQVPLGKLVGAYTAPEILFICSALILTLILVC